MTGQESSSYVCAPPAGLPWESHLSFLILSFLLLDGINSCYLGSQQKSEVLMMK